MSGAEGVPGVALSGRTIRIGTTLLITAGMVIIYRMVYARGRWLKERFDDPAVEAAQGLLGIIVTVVGLWLIVDTWATSNEVVRAMAPVQLDDTTSIRFVVTLGLFVGAYVLTRLTKRSIQAVFEGDRVSIHQREIGHHIVQVSIYGIAILLVLSLWNVPLQRLLIGAGAATIVIGLAARQTLGSLLAGFVLLFARPFEIGDWVVIGDQEGIVQDVNIVKTQLRTFDDEHVMIPNDSVTGTEIINRSREGQLRVTTEIRVDYGVDVMRAIEAANQALRHLDVDPILDDPAPQVVVRRLDPSAVILELRVWIDEPSAGRKWTARTAVAHAVTRRFEESGIDIPFPQREFAPRSPQAEAEAAGNVSFTGDRIVLTDEETTAEQAAALGSLVVDDDGGDQTTG